MRAACAAFLVLGGCGASAPDARARLAHPDPAERLSAVAELDQRPRTEARPALLRVALGDPDGEVRRAAALTLENQTRRSLEELALETLKRPDPELAGWLLQSPREAVRLSAVASLRGLGTPQAAARLAERLGAEPSAGVRFLIAGALAEAADRGAGAAHPAVLASLKDGLRDPEPSVRHACARALGLSGDPAGVPGLVEALGSTPTEEHPGLIEALRAATGEDLGQDARGWILKYGSPATTPKP